MMMLFSVPDLVTLHKDMVLLEDFKVVLYFSLDKPD